MKILVSSIVLFFTYQSFAKMDWTYTSENPVCSDAVENELHAVNILFCESTKTYSRLDFCEQSLCLINNHATHCDPVLQETVRLNQTILNQESMATWELILATERYCSDEY